MCGIIALLLADIQSNCRQDIYDGLTVLQHRGQDAAGIVTSSSTCSKRTKFHIRKDYGLVRDVFQKDSMSLLLGNSGLGHVRYPTAGEMTAAEVQPLYINYPCGLALGHNGNLTNHDELSQWVGNQHRHLNSTSDSEVLLNVFGEFLRQQLEERKGARSEGFSAEMIMTAVKKTMKLCKGGYSVVMLIHDVGVVAFRDPHGIRPLSFAKRSSKTLQGGIDYCFASESVAFDILDFELVGDVLPGECILARPMIPGNPRDNLGLFREQLFHDPAKTIPLSPCLFEYVYLARPDSIMNGISVHSAREKSGEKLAEKIQRVLQVPSEMIDVVIPIPETSRTAALKCAQKLNLPYSEGFIKNRYIARTFLMPGQSIRKQSIRLKLNTIKSEFKGKNVLLVDDSIVRGNTSRQLISLARDAGARNVIFASTAPQIIYPNVYGIDLPTRQELIAFERTNEEIEKLLGCDKVIFQDLKDLEVATRAGRVTEENNTVIEAFENSTFSGKYVTGDVDQEYFQKSEQTRGAAQCEST